jgi:hypothetical protein
MSNIDYHAALDAGLKAKVPAARPYGCGRVYVCVLGRHVPGIRAACKRAGVLFLADAYGTTGNAIYIGYDNCSGRELARGTAVAEALNAAGIDCYADAVGD